MYLPNGEINNHLLRSNNLDKSFTDIANIKNGIILA